VPERPASNFPDEHHGVIWKTLLHVSGGSVMRTIVVRLLTVALLMAATACSSTSSGPTADGEPPEPTRGGSVVVGTSGEVDGFNPLTSQWSGPAYQVGRTVLDPLVVMDRDGGWQPYLAESITPNDDFTVWTFELRPGITFHNGEVLDSDALALFFEAAVSSPLSSQGFPEEPVVTKTGDMTVTLTFTQPWSQMPTALVEQTGYVIAPEQLRSGDAQHPIGTGPFVFEEWIPDNRFRATRNPDYWRPGLPYLDSIEFRPIPDTSLRLNALRVGDIDIAEANSVGQPRLDELAAAGFTVVDDYDHVGVGNLLMNNDRPPLDDKRVREAIVNAIDREAFRDAVLDPSFELADQPFPEGSKWHTDLDYPAYDPERARDLVSEYESENGPISLSIMIIATGAPTDPAQFLQQQLAAVGIDASVDGLELVTFVQHFVSGDYDTVYLGGFFGAVDPDGSYPFITSKGAAPETLIKLNFARYRNPAVDQALQAQRETDDETARQTEWATIWRAFAEDLPYAFLAHDRTGWVTKPNVYGLGGFTTPEGVPLPAISRWTPFYTGVYLAR
jgi:peptide/nickel transport system substrate-binding protein